MSNPRPHPHEPASLDGETYLPLREAERIIGLSPYTLDGWVKRWTRDGANRNNPGFKLEVRCEGRQYLIAERQVRTLADLRKTHKLRWNGHFSLLSPDVPERLGHEARGQGRIMTEEPHADRPRELLTLIRKLSLH